MADTVNPDAEMIDVVLMRHGEAQALAGKDAARPLTQWGRDRRRRNLRKKPHQRKVFARARI